MRSSISSERQGQKDTPLIHLRIRLLYSSRCHQAQQRGRFGPFHPDIRCGRSGADEGELALVGPELQ